jgi:SHS2 domain-containing protein
VIVEAWAPTREACLREAVLGFAEAFVDVGAAAPASLGRERTPIDLDPLDDEELLVALLEDAVYLVYARGQIPINATLGARADGGISGWFETVSSASLPETGALPKGVSRSDLWFGDDGSGTWRCQVEIDV